jgi:hypothetical protein
MAQTKRTLPEILNQKAYSISLAATKLTYKTSRQQIISEIGRIANAIKVNQTGKRKGKLSKGKAIFAGQERGGAPLAALIIQSALAGKNRGVQGRRFAKMLRVPEGKGLYGADMKDAIRRLVGARISAIGFIRAGWLPAVAAFAHAIGKPVQTGTEKALARWKKYGRQLGGGSVARPGIRPVATFWNSTQSRPENTNQQNIERYAKEGLTQAVAQEIGNMKLHMERKLQAEANKFSFSR